MDDNSWIKLYRKAKYNEIIKDHPAWCLFSLILLSVDKDTGKWKAGRFLIAELLGMKSGTVYKTLQRLEKKYKMVTLSSNNRFTEITVLQWAKYQHSSQSVTQVGNNKVTTKEQQSNNKVTLNKNKRIRELRIENTNPPYIPPTPMVSVIKKKYSSLKDIDQDVLEDIATKYGVPIGMVELNFEKMKAWLESNGKVKKDYRATLRGFVLRDISQVGIKRLENRREVVDATGVESL